MDVSFKGMDKNPWVAASLKRFIAALLFSFAFLGVARVGADSEAFPPVVEFIRKAEGMARVELLSTEDVKKGEVPEGLPTFSKKSVVRLETTYRSGGKWGGDKEREWVIWHGSRWGDHLFQQGPGKYIVFLKKEKGEWVPYAGWPSSKAIRDGRVQGWKPPYFPNEECAVPHDKAQGEIIDVLLFEENPAKERATSKHSQ